jgi:CRP/FNR family transcriptional regulator
VGDLLALEALSQKQYSFSAVALSKTTLCMIPIVSLLTEMQFFPALLKRFLHINSYKMLNDKLIRPTNNAKQRVADFLVNIYYRLEQRDGKKDSFQLPMSQIDMSYMIGMAYETVSRVLHHFEDENIIRIKNRHVTIINCKQLLFLGNDLLNHRKPAATLPM